MQSKFRHLHTLMRASASARDSRGNWAAGLAAASAVGLLAYKNVAEAESDEKLTIPKMIMEREAAKKKEYEERAKVDIEEVLQGELSPEEAEDLSEADQAYLFERGQEPRTAAEQEEEKIKQIVDPYVKKRALQQVHQEYRTITIGPENLL